MSDSFPWDNKVILKLVGFICVRVSMDVTGPLCYGQLVSIGQGKQVWISFKYERLPNICYWCGCFDHDDKGYEVWLNSEGSLTQKQKQFGLSLRAAPFSYSRKQVIISVLGFYKSRPSKTQGSAEKSMVGNRKYVERSRWRFRLRNNMHHRRVTVKPVSNRADLVQLTWTIMS